MPGYFLDTSALAKLYHQESGSERMESLAQSPGAHLIISELSLIEIESVFTTKVRTGVVARTALDHLRGLFSADIRRHKQKDGDVVLLARRHFRNAGVLVRLYAVDQATRSHFGTRRLRSKPLQRGCHGGTQGAQSDGEGIEGRTTPEQ